MVIVNPANSNAISEDEVQRIFLGKKSTFNDGSKATPYALTPGPTSDAFSEKALGKSASQLKAYWSKLVFTGKGIPPSELAGAKEAVSTVAKDASAIAYVDSAAVDASVKVVATYP